jgi:3-hydroxyisobutyrate dehydrogenase
METIGLIGPGKIGLPIAENLIKSGYKVLGYRRGSMADFEKIGGTPAKSPADIGKQCDVVLSCVDSAAAMEQVLNGPQGLIHSARPGQIIVELGSHPVPIKEKHVATFAQKGAAYLDGEVSGTPGMVQARKGVIYLAGDADAAKKIEPVIKGFADLSIYFGPFGGASKVKLINNLLVSINIAAAAEAMALGLKAGVDIDAMIKAVANGSGGTTQFSIRAPWMAQRKFKPIQGSPKLLSHYFGMIDNWADSIGVATPIFDRAVELYEHCDKMGLADDNDVSVMIDVLNDIPREKHGKKDHA